MNKDYTGREVNRRSHKYPAIHANRQANIHSSYAQVQWSREEEEEEGRHAQNYIHSLKRVKP